jgi:hypothetical protein
MVVYQSCLGLLLHSPTYVVYVALLLLVLLSQASLLCSHTVLTRNSTCFTNGSLALIYMRCCLCS